MFGTFDGEVILMECAAYFFGTDVVVFVRTASPAAAEGRPHILALVATRLVSGPGCLLQPVQSPCDHDDPLGPDGTVFMGPVLLGLRLHLKLLVEAL